jgi:Prion-inhibition and propagation
MADLAGAVIGGVALAALFASCVECFDYVQLGRKFGSDYETSQLKLDLVKLRLSRWGESVRINGDPAARLHVAVASSEDQETVKRLLGHIHMLFEDAKNKSVRFQQFARPDERELFAAQDGVTLQGFHQTVRILSNRRQKRTNWTKKVAWALYEKKQFNEVITDITTLVNELIDLFPAAQTSQQQICKVEVSEISASANEQNMTMLKDTASGVDDLMESVITQIINGASGHTFEGLRMGEQSKLMMGNLYVHRAQPAQAPCSGHSYKNIVSSGSAIGLLGDQHGGKGFWDS